MTAGGLASFAADYARHRAAEGRGHAGADLFALPYLRHGPLARQWSVRARSFEMFLGAVVRPLARRLGRPLVAVDLGAGNGWLSHRLALEGHRSVALDVRSDSVDGLGAAAPLARSAPDRMARVAGSFEALPLRDAAADLAVFNASLHYALDLERALAEAARIVRPGGMLAILDSPVYRRERDGLAMAAEKRAGAGEQFGQRAEVLLSRPVIEFLTLERLRAASASRGLRWRRRRVAYPLWYELRPALAALRRRRAPSRFDLWTSVRP